MYLFAKAARRLPDGIHQCAPRSLKPVQLRQRLQARVNHSRHPRQYYYLCVCVCEREKGIKKIV